VGGGHPGASGGLRGCGVGRGRHGAGDREDAAGRECHRGPGDARARGEADPARRRRRTGAGRWLGRRGFGGWFGRRLGWRWFERRLGWRWFGWVRRTGGITGGGRPGVRDCFACRGV